MTALSKKVFAQGMGLLSARWNREMIAELSRIYAAAFHREQLTAEEFITGVERAIEGDEFYPTALRIIELARPLVPAASRAGEVFEQVLQLRRYDPRYGTTLSLDTISQQLGDPARHAVVSIGGARRLVNLTDDAFPFVLRDFARAFADFDRDERSRIAAGRMLPSGNGRTAGLTAQTPVPFFAEAREATRKRLTSPVAVASIVAAVTGAHGAHGAHAAPAPDSPLPHPAAGAES